MSTLTLDPDRYLRDLTEEQIDALEWRLGSLPCWTRRHGMASLLSQESRWYTILFVLRWYSRQEPAGRPAFGVAVVDDPPEPGLLLVPTPGQRVDMCSVDDPAAIVLWAEVVCGLRERPRHDFDKGAWLASVVERYRAEIDESEPEPRTSRKA